MSSRLELRKINRKLVYRTLLKREEMSKQEIAYATGLSIPTVTQDLRDLEQEGLVETSGIMESTGGRRAEGFKAVRDARFSVGIDITQNHITVAIVNVASDIVAISNRERFKFRDTKECYAEIMKRVSGYLKQHAVTEQKLLGVGVSVPCIVDRHKNEVTYSEIIEKPEKVIRMFHEKFPGKIELYNDANAAGFAEMWGREMPQSSGRMLFYFMLSNSVGGAMLNRTGIYLGDSCRSAEIGHIRIVPKGRPCYCGQNGCVNAYCSAKLLSDRADGKLEKFFRKLEEGDKESKKAFDEYLSYLAIATVNLRMLYDCNIILGGYTGAYLEPYIDRLRAMVAELNPYEDGSDYLIPCEFKQEASAVGAALTFVGDFISG